MSKLYCFPWNCKQTNLRRNFAKIGVGQSICNQEWSRVKKRWASYYRGIQSETRYGPTTGAGGWGSSCDSEQWFSKCSPQINSISIIWESVNMQNFRPHLDPLNQKLWGGAQKPVFYWELQVNPVQVNVWEPEVWNDPWDSFKCGFCDSSPYTGNVMPRALRSPWLPALAFPPNWASSLE